MVENSYNRKGFKVNMKKIKAFCMKERIIAIEASFHSHYVEKKVESNYWMHKKCSGIIKCCTKVIDLVCKKCLCFTGSTEIDE